MIDFAIVIAYFAIILTIGLRARADARVGPKEDFLSSRSLRWPCSRCGATDGGSRSAT